jgi:hypothetical protein
MVNFVSLVAPLLALVLWLIVSVLTALQRYPGDPDDFGERLARALARFAFLRFYDSPGTLHFPGTAQPPPWAAQVMIPPTGTVAAPPRQVPSSATTLLILVLAITAVAACQSQAQRAVHADHAAQTLAIGVCEAHHERCDAARACSAAKVTAAKAWRVVAADAVSGIDATADTSAAQKADASATSACSSFSTGAK